MNPVVTTASSSPASIDFAPIAVIGLSAAFPGGDSVRDYWHLLQTQRCALRAVGPQRLRRLDETTPGGFLTALDQFDPRHFKITPTEAQWMAPEHRLLLEQSWRAFEHAGYTQQCWRKESVGVFVGLCPSEYPELVLEALGTKGVNAYYSSGSALSTAAGRLAYFYGFQGPCLSVDTACSSSLVALHQACHSLIQEECSLALVAGVNVLLTEPRFRCFQAAKMLSPTGNCRPFDAAADGYVRGEGCGVVLLKPLAAALAAGDRVVALIRATAINQDGQSASLIAPNGKAQEAVMSVALARAQLAPEAVQYVEAHGTGTPLGDLVELTALSRVYAHARRPLWIGSVKANVGHLEAAAGMAGLIKLIVSLHRNQIVPQIHCSTPNPRFDWKAHQMELPTVARPWQEDPRVRRYGAVSSFGFSGSNAHAVLSSYAPEESYSPRRARSPVSWRRQSYWVKPAQRSSAGPAPALAEYAALKQPHPFLSNQWTEVEGALSVFETRLSAEEEAEKYLFEHRLAGGSLLPMAFFCELALAASKAGTPLAAGDSGPQWVLSELLIPQPYELTEFRENRLKTVLLQKASDRYELTVFRLQNGFSQSLASSSPVLQPAEARLTAATQGDPLLPLPLPVSIEQWRAAELEGRGGMDCADFYRTLSESALLHYGLAFRVIKTLNRYQQTVYGTLSAMPGVSGTQRSVVLLDGCFQVAAIAATGDPPACFHKFPLWPVRLGSLHCLRELPAQVVCCCRVHPVFAEREWLVDFDAYSVEGVLLLSGRRLLLKAVRVEEVVTDRASRTNTVATRGRSSVETTLLSLMKELAGWEGDEFLDPSLSLTELGYDSLKSMQLVQRLQDLFAIRIPLTEILFEQSVSGLIQYCEGEVVSQKQRLIGRELAERAR